MTPEQRAQRVHHHMYDTCEGIAEHAERIVALEELVLFSHGCKVNEGDCESCWNDEGCCPVERRMQELGVEVTEQ